MDVGYYNDIGKRRNSNEDSYIAMPAIGLYIVADGVSSEKAGEVASKLATDGIAQMASYVISKNKNITLHQVKELLAICIDRVNEEIITLGKRDIAHRGMATTLLVAYISGDEVLIANVGDSRAYLYHGNKIKQITEDHTYVNELIKRGAISKTEAKTHEKRAYITRAIGAYKDVYPDFFTAFLGEGDVVMLCSDGLYDEVGDDKIEEILSQSNDMNSACKALVCEANKNGGRDNITVMCIKK